MDVVRLVRSEAPGCHPKDPFRPSKHEHRVPATYAGMVEGISPRGVLLERRSKPRAPAREYVPVADGGFAGIGHPSRSRLNQLEIPIPSGYVID